MGAFATTCNSKCPRAPLLLERVLATQGAPGRPTAHLLAAFNERDADLDTARAATAQAVRCGTDERATRKAERARDEACAELRLALRHRDELAELKALVAQISEPYAAASQLPFQV